MWSFIDRALEPDLKHSVDSKSFTRDKHSRSLQSIVPICHFKPSPILAGKAGAYLSGALS
jgi:hypothetical protein